MRLKTLRISTALTTAQAASRLAELFEAEGVSVERSANALNSTKVKLPWMGVDRALYTRRNWIGLNPFVWLTGIRAGCTPGSDGRTVVTLVLDRRRTILWVACWFALVGIVSLQAPLPGALAVLAVVALANMVGWLLGPVLVRNEVEAQLR
jgi:hypothetical protein